MTPTRSMPPLPRPLADKPTLICCKTHIGKGSPNRANTSKAHGEPLGAEEIRLTREALGWTYGLFEIPQEVYAAWDAKKPAKPPRRLEERFAAQERPSRRKPRNSSAA